MLLWKNRSYARLKGQRIIEKRNETRITTKCLTIFDQRERKEEYFMKNDLEAVWNDGVNGRIGIVLLPDRSRP